jgi:DNA replication protein DnaC
MKDQLIEQYATELQLLFLRENFSALAQQAAQQQWSFSRFLGALLEGESHRRQDNRVRRRIKAARFPALKRLEDFDWSWPKKINRPQVQELFRLRFLEEHANVIFLGGVGLGKSHLAIALGYAAALQGHSVLFTTAVDVINTLAAAQAAHQLKRELKKYLSPALLIMDEVGYLPIDKIGADLLFQVLSQRYESGSVVLTTNQPYKRWPRIFNNDTTLTSAILDRLLHHAYTLTLEGRSYRMKDQIED